MSEPKSSLPHPDTRRSFGEGVRCTERTGESAIVSSATSVSSSRARPDVTEYREAAVSPREQVTQLGKMFSYDWDIATDVIVRSRECVDILGLHSDSTSTTGRELFVAIHPDDREQVHAAIGRLNAENPTYQASMRVFRTDGNIVRLDWLGRGSLDQQGRLTRMTGVALKVGETNLRSLQEEAAVRESESLYRRIVEATNEGIWLLDSKLLNSYVNPQMAEMLGYAPGEMVGRSVFDFYFPEDIEQKKQTLRRRKEGLREQIEERVQRRDGSELWVRMAVIPMFKENGEFDGALAMVSDITERKRAEQSLRLFRALIDESNDAIEVVDPGTLRFLDVNEKACRELGYSRDELLSLRVPDIDPMLDESSHAGLQKNIGESGSVLFERVHRRKDGSTYPVEINQKRVLLDRPYCVNVVRDITERKRVEEALRQKGSDLSEAQRLARIGSWQWDGETDTVIWSEELYRIAGRDPRLPALSYREHSQLYSRESWERLQQVVDEALRTGSSYELDLEMIRPDGTTGWVTARGAPQRDASGLVVRLSGTVQDITERKLAEKALASVSRRLIEAQEQERTRIARELHDDIGQRLALMAVELEQLREGPPDSPAKVTSLVDELWKRTNEMATDVQYLSHELHSSKLEYLGLAVAMRSFCKDFSEQRNVEVDLKIHDLPSSLPPEISLCLFRVLQEALHNSAKHSGVRRAEARLWETADEIHLTVRDCGKGFDTKVAKQSQGLGLVSMEERLKLLNGTFSIESQPSRGTTIHAHVPFGQAGNPIRAAG